MTEERKKTQLEVISNMYREATEYDAGKVLTISKNLISILRQNSKLHEIAKRNIGSLVDCVRQAIGLNLTIDSNNYCYLIPYKNIIKLQIGYQGYIYKVKQNYPDVIFQVSLVKEGDEVVIHKEKNNDYVDHKYTNPFNNEEKKIIGVYSIITIKDKTIVNFMNRKEIDNVKSIAKTKDIWSKWEGEMCKKSIIRRACKVHFSSEIKDLNDFDNQYYDVSRPSKTKGLEDLNKNIENK